MQILNIVLPLFTGGVGIWIGYYLKWDIEKRKIRHEERKVLLSDIRKIIIKFGGNHPEYFIPEFYNSIEYSRIKTYLSKDLILKLESKNITNYSSYILLPTNILQDINRIEKEWELI